MIIGIIGDTHNCPDDNIIAVIRDEFLRRGVQIVVHTGDIELQHVKADLFFGLPVICVLTKFQAFDPNFSFAPSNWRFIRPSYNKDPLQIIGRIDDEAGDSQLAKAIKLLRRQMMFCRLVPLCVGKEIVMAYCGHELSQNLLNDMQTMANFFAEVNQVYDGVRLAFCGHTHHQILRIEDNVTLVNPGSINTSWNGTKEFAIVDTEKNYVVLGRLSRNINPQETFTVGIVSDTGNVDQLDAGFWQRLRHEFNERGVTHVICCGHFLPVDIGRPELAGLETYYYLMPGLTDVSQRPGNWHSLSHDNPIVEICGHRFYVQHGIGPEFAKFSEMQSKEALGGLLERCKHLDYIVAGLVPGVIVQESDANYTFLNSGDARTKKRFLTVCLPRGEITSGIA